MGNSSNCNSSSSDSSDNSFLSSSSWKEAEAFLFLLLIKASNHLPTGSTGQSVEAVIESDKRGFKALHGADLFQDNNVS